MSDRRDELRKRKAAYQRCLDNEVDGEVVMSDLAEFCYANKPTFSMDDPSGRIQAYREGRREVYLRIREFLNLTDAEIDRFKS